MLLRTTATLENLLEKVVILLLNSAYSNGQLLVEYHSPIMIKMGMILKIL